MSSLNKRSYRRVLSFVAFFIGGAVGVNYAPAHQMAALVIGFFGGVTAQTTSFCASSGTPKGLILAILATAIGCALTFVVVRENRAEVVTACLQLVFICGTIGTIAGCLTGRWLASRKP